MKAAASALTAARLEIIPASHPPVRTGLLARGYDAILRGELFTITRL
jgi:hypothetical protein